METIKGTQLNLETTVSTIIEESINQKVIDRLYTEMKGVIDSNGEVNLIIQANDIKSIKNLKSFFSDIKDKWFVLKHLRKFAIVTDKDWIENLTEIVGVLTPKVELKEFDMVDMDEAIDWVNSPTINEKHGMAIWPKENFLHLIVYDKLTMIDYKILNRTMRDYEKEVSLLIQFLDFEGITLRAFLEDLKMGFSHYRKFKKIAIVPNKNIESLIKITNLVTPGIQFKSFDYHEMDIAAKWLNEI
ncbi:STAS/SEC14 domain-containing protein [Aureibaculum algae]|uniref:STAS/SEC14 domain-containing protein n=1 Tax=Aureibaculum algae TaxID=2584122 RepID=A0A5B7TTV3_9FLAO|nr:STAS/SEC14 domain-containing protein [Aureibaculum algae]QCX38731.1 STAS/SEC14 domain-containing protein [Aureibaculum algae]